MSTQEMSMIEMFYDGDCPLCMREVRMLKRMDRHGRIRFTDIAVQGFDAGALGKDRDTMMATIHGRLPSGEMIEGVEVFRRLYEAVGLGWLSSLSRAPGISRIAEIAYATFARNRLRLTGRCSRESCERGSDGAQERARP